MDAKQIRTATTLNLKQNPYFVLNNKPFLYQKRGILMQLVRPRLILGDDVGLGKTFEKIVAFTYLKAQRPNLRAVVLTEKMAYKQWLDEIAANTIGLKAKIITTGTYPDPAARVRAFRQHGMDIIITSYSSMYNYSHHIIEGLGPEWELIADEPNYFKNTETLLWKSMRGAIVGDPSGRAYRVVREQIVEAGKKTTQDRMVHIDKGERALRSTGLTATVIENKLEEAYGVFSIVAPHCFQSEAQFQRDYCVRKKVKRGVFKTVGYKNLDKFRAQIEPFFYGRLQDDPEVEQDLPEAIPKDVPIILSREQSSKVLEAMDRIIAMPSGEVRQPEILPAMTIAQQLVDMPEVLGFNIVSEKMEALLETLTNSLAGERVMIFSKLRRVIDAIENHLRKAQLDCVRVTGKERDFERERAKERFMSDGPDRCNIILGTNAIIKAANLQKGNHLFCFDMPWSYGWYRQLVGRLKRTGSSHKRIGVYRMLGCLHPDIAVKVGSEKTIDHFSLETVQKKFQLFKAITGDITEIESANTDVVDIYHAVRMSRK